ncbi:GTPase Era [Candidatus Gottesmanbacteria bacterium RIFCSPHIGHO2_01_FULL_39_10]|uniref:GTPase Era n=1 Tax=Candidatus Gottesmanbacteria bacterium RIFCSPHIGHO2_01_FULL_39_10 TaxID=1798375 RepID=A0A1F5ZS24_9BACT|nr:MAG: GTPase Era [Candidatus Gottesmanbacteria bacterium RIFCSPHIGHO2_01_FULL_39_10]
MKSGYVAIVGRPNTGKSTLLNNILGHKVTVTSPKPQTTRFPIEAVFEDERGQIIFIDTPGVMGRVDDPVGKKINPKTESRLAQNVDVMVYLIDHTRDRDFEENKTLGIARKFKIPKILAVNKSDIKKPDYYPHYKFMEEEFSPTIHISALFKWNFNYLLDAIFEYLPEKEKIIKDVETRATPLLSMDSKQFIGEIIREKAYIFLRKEVPYTLVVMVDEINKKENGVMYIKARIITNDDRYKRMIIGEKGRMVKEIGMAARKELETATNQKVFIDLTVEVNPHWTEEML